VSDPEDEPTTDPGPESATHDGSPLNEGLHHLESAARELIEAGRSFLDALEGAIGSSDSVEGLLRAFTGRAEPPDSSRTADPPDGFEDIPVD
jgi:hypothetical protein